MGEIMGCVDSKELNDDPNKPIRLQSVGTARGKYTALTWTEKEPVGFPLPTPPLLNNNQLIFLSTVNKTTSYTVYDLNTSQYTTKSQEIKCDDSFDVGNTVYTLNPDNNKIYFIEHNQAIKALDLAQNVLISLNKSITTTEKNVAQIQYNNGVVYVIGAEEKSQESAEYILIPYSSANIKVKSSGAVKAAIKKAGTLARVINVQRDGEHRIYIMGGKKDYSRGDGAKPRFYPYDSIWRLYGLDKNGAHKWDMEMHTNRPQHSFGVINYKNEYLMCFGGEEFNKQKKKKDIVPYLSFIPMVEGKKDLRKNHWYEIHRKLPKKGFYHAFCVEDRVHLFDYDGGHYVIKMKDILEVIKAGGCQVTQQWSEGGKTVLPTKDSAKIEAPKKLPVEALLESLGDEYEDYWDDLEDEGYTNYEDIVSDAKGSLVKFVTNEEHRNKIIEEAKKLV